MFEDDQIKQPKKWGKEEAYDRITKYCSFQERSLKDVRSKLLTHGIYKADLEKLINQLLEENIIDELRYASSYVRGKFKYNHWGKVKIINELRFEQIPNSIINQALKEIDEKEYQLVARNEIKKKIKTLQRKESTTAMLRKKIFSYMVQKGFSYDEINQAFENAGKF